MGLFLIFLECWLTNIHQLTIIYNSPGTHPFSTQVWTTTLAMEMAVAAFSLTVIPRTMSASPLQLTCFLNSLFSFFLVHSLSLIKNTFLCFPRKHAKQVNILKVITSKINFSVSQMTFWLELEYYFRNHFSSEE